MSAAPARPASPVRFYLLLACLCAATVLGLGVSNGSPAAAVAPVGALLVVWAVRKLPVRNTLLAVVLMALCAEYLAERPAGDAWRSPFYPLGQLLFTNFNQLTGVGALRFQGMDLVIVSLCALVLYQRATGRMKDAPAPLAAVLPPFVGLVLLGLVYIEARGAARGGNMRESLWQIHQLAFVPLLIFLYASTLRGSRDLVALARVVVTAACVKAAVGIYFIYFVARPRGLMVEFATSHSDTFTFVTALLILLVRWLEQPTSGRLVRSLPLLLWVGWGMFLNDRRLAYVSLAGSLLTIFLMMPWTPIKRWVVRAIIVALPLLPLYVGLGWSRQGALFGPVQTLKSLVVGDSVSAPDYREIENFNVIVTWMFNPWLGNGAGHEFALAVDLPDISAALPTWRYHPHNQLLWLWSHGGLLGWTMLWLYLVVAVYLGARVYHRAWDPRQRTAALVGISVVIVYINQVFGDMGTLTWIGAVFISGTVVVLGQLAAEVGVWPRRAVRSTPVEALPRAAEGELA